MEKRGRWQRVPTFSGQICLVYFSLPPPTKALSQCINSALMKGLLAELPAADPLDLECVFTINPPLCLQRLHPSCIAPSLTHKQPHLQEQVTAPVTDPLSSIYAPVLHTYTIVHMCCTPSLQVNTRVAYAQTRTGSNAYVHKPTWGRTAG